MEGNFCVGFILFLCLVWQVQAEINCTTTGAGRVADDSDTTCKNYTLCIFNSATNTYVSYDYTCPTTSLFNPNTAQCTTDYVCNATNTSGSSVCTEEGFVADPTSTNCTGYILCVNISGVFEETPYTCPDSSFYDPETTLCVTDYNCTTSSIFTCTAAGRFPNTADTTCQTYYLCVFVSTNSSYADYKYTCPTTSVFSPTTRVCTTSYVCPTA